MHLVLIIFHFQHDKGNWMKEGRLGFPTSVGCLCTCKAVLAKLRGPWYAGGTITFNDGSGKPNLTRGDGKKATTLDLLTKRYITVIR